MQKHEVGIDAALHEPFLLDTPEGRGTVELGHEGADHRPALCESRAAQRARMALLMNHAALLFAASTACCSSPTLTSRTKLASHVSTA